MCDVLIFSKDRACQLDALLRSIEENGPGYSSVTVLYVWSDYAQGEAYWQLTRAGHAVRWLPQDRFSDQTRSWLERAGDVLSFLVDDQIFYGKATLAPSPGMVYQYGLNTTRSHTMGGDSHPHVQVARDGWFTWTWRDSTGDFAYPLSIGGNVYDKAELLEAWPDHFDSPTSLEAQLACYAAWWSRETLAAPIHSCLVSLPHNRVTTQATNPISSDERWTAVKLCEAYLDGQRIDYEAMDFSSVDAAHSEVPLVLSK